MIDQSQRARPRTTLDEIFEALSQPTRRRILTSLVKANPREVDYFTPRDFTREERREDDLGHLYHTHLPKLAKAGFIDWDHDAGTITRGPRFDEIASFVELIIAHRDELPADWP